MHVRRRQPIRSGLSRPVGVCLSDLSADHQIQEGRPNNRKEESLPVDNWRIMRTQTQCQNTALIKKGAKR